MPTKDNWYLARLFPPPPFFFAATGFFFFFCALPHLLLPCFYEVNSHLSSGLSHDFKALWPILKKHEKIEAVI